MRGYNQGDEEIIDQAQHLAEKSCGLDDEDSEGHRILCEIHLMRRNYDISERHHEMAYALNPNDPRILGQRGQLYTVTGRAAEAVPWLELARRLDPYPPELRADSLGHALFVDRRYGDALKAYELITNPTAGHQASLAACHAMLDHAADARRHVERALQLAPEFTAKSFLGGLLYRNQPDIDHHREALLKAGLE